MYVKNFPENTTEEQVKEFFYTYGEIESIKLFPPNGPPFTHAFVCYKQPEFAVNAKKDCANRAFNGKTLYVSNYEIKEVRELNKEIAQDKIDY